MEVFNSFLHNLNSEIMFVQNNYPFSSILLFTTGMLCGYFITCFCLFFSILSRFFLTVFRKYFFNRKKSS